VLKPPSTSSHTAVDKRLRLSSVSLGSDTRRIVDDAGKALGHDGKAVGHLQVRAAYTHTHAHAVCRSEMCSTYMLGLFLWPAVAVAWRAARNRVTDALHSCALTHVTGVGLSFFLFLFLSFTALVRVPRATYTWHAVCLASDAKPAIYR
jgi:hypothetical protein